MESKCNRKLSIDDEKLNYKFVLHLESLEEDRRASILSRRKQMLNLMLQLLVFQNNEIISRIEEEKRN